MKTQLAWILQVVVSTLDVADAEGTEQLLQLASQMAPVGGIFHLAMVMADKWIANQVLSINKCCSAHFKSPSCYVFVSFLQLSKG